jgi:hypothetical protein
VKYGKPISYREYIKWDKQWQKNKYKRKYKK